MPYLEIEFELIVTLGESINRFLPAYKLILLAAIDYARTSSMTSVATIVIDVCKFPP